jgi:hypothetical protein
MDLQISQISDLSNFGFPKNLYLISSYGPRIPSARPSSIMEVVVPGEMETEIGFLSPKSGERETNPTRIVTSIL